MTVNVARCVRVVVAVAIVQIVLVNVRLGAVTAEISTSTPLRIVTTGVLVVVMKEVDVMKIVCVGAVVNRVLTTGEAEESVIVTVGSSGLRCLMASRSRRACRKADSAPASGERPARIERLKAAASA